MPDEKPKLEGFMTVPEAAAKIGKTKTTLYSAIEAGHLKYTPIGKRGKLISAADLEAWLNNPDAHKLGPKFKKLGT